MKAVIIAGGIGKRMGYVTNEVPKPMLNVGGIPILAHQVMLLKKYGITDIHLLVNYLKDNIIDYFGNGGSFGVNIKYYEEPLPLGTVGGIKEVEDQLTEDFVVLYGDVMINMHIGRLIRFHYEKSSECTLVLHPNDHPFDSDLVETDNTGRIIRFYPKPHDPQQYYPNLVNAGAYIFSPSILAHLAKGRKADFGREVFPAICNKVKMYGYNTAEYLKDIGTPERWAEVEHDWDSGKITLSSYEHKQKAIFLDRDGVINEEISFISKPEDLILYDFTVDAIRKINQSDYKAIVVSNQSVIARNLCTLEELKAIHNKMETDLGKKRAKIDAIYFCPHHPDKGYKEERTEYKIDCLCRKPKPGMLLDAARDFNLDLSASFIIGDNDRDILAGINAGCKTVGVMTGYGLKKASVLPDFFFENFAEAVDYIVNEPHNKLFEQVKAAITKTPTLIAIGGNARSGKSTLTSYLKWKFENEGRKVLKIELDNWILPEKQRQHCKNVFDRFRLSDIETDIQKILAGIEVEMKTYANHPDRKPDDITYLYKGEDIIFIEGVVALSSEIIRSISHLKVFTGIDKEQHMERIKKYYLWRGKKIPEIKKLYKQRLTDEYLFIEKDSKFADIVVNSTAL
jgi:histidinol-phosphate phosphatase family protein